MILTKNKVKAKEIIKKAINALILFALVFNLGFIGGANVKEAQAYTNMLKEGSFETNIEGFWTKWQNPDSTRKYDVYRSYESAFGFGSHSVGIRASKGQVEEYWKASFLPREDTNSFNLENGKKYYLALYVKGTHSFDTRVTLSNNQNYEAVDGFRDVPVTNNWTRHVLIFNSNITSGGTMSINYGNLPEGAEFYIDGIQLFEDAVQVVTTGVSGNIGKNRILVKVNNISFFTQSEIEVELPYFNEVTSTAGVKKFNPSEVTSSGFYINMYEGTFSGIAKIYGKGQLLGEFDYNVIPVLVDFFPTMFHADEDVVIRGSGFHPQVDIDKMYVIVKIMDLSGATYDHYVKPHSVDPKLKQVTIKLPVGVVNSSVFIQTSFRNIAGEDIVNKSNKLNYIVKPVIYKSEWSKMGYDQVGDKIKIYGKGISNRPSVNFYDVTGVKVATMKGTLLEIGEEEIIEVATPINVNMLNITVQVGTVESDRASAIAHSAKPLMKNLKTSKTRFMSGSETIIPAAKNGEEITIYGNSLFSTLATTTIEFQGLNKRIQVQPSSTDTRGSWIKVIVPNGALNGYINIELNGSKSNYLPIEIIPTIVELQPSEITPGSLMAIHANGVGSVASLTKVHFNMSGEKIEVNPESINASENSVIVNVRVPMAISSKYTSINLQYDKWIDDSSPVLNVNPVITNASMDTDSKILVIRGYGFSIHPRENIITYKYADENKTVINPKVRVLGVYPTEEGQEIRIQVQDDYHFGYVQIKVADRVSNEVNFGPVSIRSIARRVQYVETEDKIMGVLYINGYNFGEKGGVRVGGQWAKVHYRTNFFIIAVLPEANVNDNPVIITKE